MRELQGFILRSVNTFLVPYKNETVVAEWCVILKKNRIIDSVSATNILLRISVARAWLQDASSCSWDTPAFWDHWANMEEQNWSRTSIRFAHRNTRQFNLLMMTECILSTIDGSGCDAAVQRRPVRIGGTTAVQSPQSVERTFIASARRNGPKSFGGWRKRAFFSCAFALVLRGSEWPSVTASGNSWIEFFFVAN